MTTQSLRPGLHPALDWAIEAAQNKKAAGVILLDFAELGAFTDAFLLCTGFSARQVQAICDEIEEQLARRGVRPDHREGYEKADWVLLDYGDFIVHIFTERTRLFYDLERLWRAARRFVIPDAAAGARPDGAAPGAAGP